MPFLAGCVEPDGGFVVRDALNNVIYENTRERDDTANGPWTLRMGDNGNIQIKNAKASSQGALLGVWNDYVEPDASLPGPTHMPPVLPPHH